jgi:transformation/transcription domain-associated protein
MMKEEFQNTRIDLFMEIGEKMVPDTILTNVSPRWIPDATSTDTFVLTQYMVKTMNGASEVWMMRKQFTLQLAAVNFMTYIFCLAGRNASRFSIARDTGRIIMHELTPCLSRSFFYSMSGTDCALLFGSNGWS